MELREEGKNLGSEMNRMKSKEGKLIKGRVLRAVFIEKYVRGVVCVGGKVRRLEGNEWMRAVCIETRQLGSRRRIV